MLGVFFCIYMCHVGMHARVHYVYACVGMWACMHVYIMCMYRVHYEYAYVHYVYVCVHMCMYVVFVCNSMCWIVLWCHLFLMSPSLLVLANSLN